MSTLPSDHPSRIAVTNELHARPFAQIEAPCRISHLAIACEAGQFDEMADHLLALCERFGAPRPADGAAQIILDLGRFRLKWERHTEFIAVTVIAGPDAPGATPFASPALELLPREWRARMPGSILAAVHVHCETRSGEPGGPMPAHLGSSFNRDSLIGGSVADGAARFFGDFRIHEDGFTRFAIVCRADPGESSLGRLVQQLIEVETYRTAAMLTLPEARGLWPRLNEIDAALAQATGAIGRHSPEGEREVLDSITALSAEIERVTARNAFRLDAADAYAAIAWSRIEVLSGAPIPGVVDLAGFMLRRFDPAMRSCAATRARLESLSERATRAATLLRTRIDVAMEEQNRAVLASLNERSALQLRLQETVEGFSVVAIGYYAVGLAALVLAPLAARAGVSESWVKGLVVGPILLVVWLFLRRVKARAMRPPER